MSDKVAKTVKVIAPKGFTGWGLSVYATEDPTYPQFYAVNVGDRIFSVGIGDVDQYIEVFTKIKKQLEKAGK